MALGNINFSEKLDPNLEYPRSTSENSEYTKYFIKNNNISKRTKLTKIYSLEKTKMENSRAEEVLTEYGAIFHILKNSCLKDSTVSNIMKIVEEKSLPSARIEAVLSHASENNWNDGAIYLAFKNEWILKEKGIFEKKKFNSFISTIDSGKNINPSEKSADSYEMEKK